MNKKILIVGVAVIAAAALLLLCGLPLFSRLYYGRSQAATLVAWQFHKDKYTTEEDFQSYLAEKQTENALSYVLPEDVELTSPLLYSEHQGMRYYILNPLGAPEKLIVYFAGGSYIDQPRSTHWQFLDELSLRTGAMIIIPIYPKLPDNTAAEAYAALLSFSADVLDCQDRGELFFMGDSAGGGMALSLAMQLRDSGMTGPDELILLSPWVDVSMSNPDIAEYEKNDTALDSLMLTKLGLLWADDLGQYSPAVSPLYGNLSGLCHISLFVGTGELLYPDIMKLDVLLDTEQPEHSTYTAEGMFHIWPLFSSYSIPESKEAFEQICGIIGE